jgi:hypothetical protein
MEKQLQILADITALLSGANVAVPLIFGVVSSISMIIKGVTGSGPTLVELADKMEAQLGANDANIKAEIARLKGIVGPH